MGPGYDFKLHPVVEFRWANEVTLCHNYLQVTLEQGVAPVSSPRGHEVQGWRPVGASLSHG